jgi:nitrite reductase (NADH) small subunit
MATEKMIGRVSQIPKGEGRNFEIEGLRLAVFRTQEDEILAIQAECPHRAGPLADGLLGGGSVICPLHDWTFDLRTGAGKECNVKTYPVRATADGTIIVALESVVAPVFAGE